MGNDVTELDRLREALAAEQRKNQGLSVELKKHRDLLLKNSLESEAEEECIINKLNKRMDQLLREKARLALEVEREEELITNTLQKQLAQLRKDKVDLENQMEQEQECMVNKLQRQVSILEKEKKDMNVKHGEYSSQMATLIADLSATTDAALKQEFSPDHAKKYYDALKDIQSIVQNR